ncbi:MAG: dTDP-glucose 4,6-dehydratase [Rhodospirillaceae bacterium TMED167]|nr:dTDP-glucose 4,6-dehydratase [Rhodospirillaceae bacterium]OUW23572.1 MAG: dTDP-glucose 4,6-dehydratase [Rhodospirillaceae bacterium TMED167]
MSTYIVTGGAGFIGSAFVRKALNFNDKVIVLDALTYSGYRQNLIEVEHRLGFEFVEGNIKDTALMASLLSKFQPDAIINFAAESHVDRSIESSKEFVSTNIVGTNILLQTALNYWQKIPLEKQRCFRFLQVSTDEVYGSLRSGEANEQSPSNPRSPYAASKASADMLTRSYFFTHKLPTLITLGCNTYGPRQFPEKFIPLIILRALSGMSLPVYGDGTNIREWIHVDDHAEAIHQVLKNAIPGDSYNLGSGYRIPNLEVVRALCLAIGELAPASPSYDSLIEYVTDRPGHDYRYAMDASKIEKELGWRANIKFGQGLVSTVRWYLENQEWWKPITAGQYGLNRIGLGNGS